jgi:hypothetical protein
MLFRCADAMSNESSGLRDDLPGLNQWKQALIDINSTSETLNKLRTRRGRRIPVRKLGCEMSNAGVTRTVGRPSHHLRLRVTNREDYESRCGVGLQQGKLVIQQR